MKYLSIVLACAFFCAVQGLSRWQPPAAHIRYNEVCFLTSHNSYAATGHGYYYAQQTWTIKEQLEAGVRGLMLDIHEDSSHKIMLCHGNPFITRVICRGKSPIPFHEALVTMRQFLEHNADAIITIFLENYVQSQQLLDAAFLDAGLEPYILTPAAWNPVAKGGWPTIGWMRKKNKRLLIFNPPGQTIFTFNQWEHVVENQWGALPPSRACKERNESKKWRANPRYLYAVNYFPRLKFRFDNAYAHLNTTGLDVVLKRLSKGLDKNYCKKRLPNFLCIDFVDEGDGMKRVNEINERAQNQDDRKRLFYRIHVPSEGRKVHGT